MIERQLVFYNTRDELLRIDVAKIVYFEGDGNYTHIVMVNKLKGSVCMNLLNMERELSDQLGPRSGGFMRIGKRFIINMQYIYQINLTRQMLILSDYDHFTFQLSISKEALKKVKELLLIAKV